MAELLQENLPLAAAVLVGTLTGAAMMFSSSSKSPPPQSEKVIPKAATQKTEKKKKNKKKKTATGEANADPPATTEDDATPPVEATAETSSKKKKKKKSKSKSANQPAADASESAKPAKEVKQTAPKSNPKPQHASASAGPVAPADEEWVMAKPAKKNKERKNNAPAKKTAPAVTESSAASTVKGKVEVPSKKIGVLIGPGGETLHKLQDATGTRITTPKGENPSVNAIVTVEGPADGVSKCTRAIRDLASKGYSAITHPGFSEGCVQMLPMYFHILIGKEGAGIRGLQDAFGVKIVMPEKRDTNETKPQYVKLVGSKTAIERAKAEIKTMMRCYYSPTVFPGLTHIELDLLEGQIRDVIGIRGSTIKSIQGDTNTKIHTPKQGSLNQKVVVVGKPADVERAKKQISRALVRAVENREARANERFDDYAEDWDDDDADGW